METPTAQWISNSFVLDYRLPRNGVRLLFRREQLRVSIDENDSRTDPTGQSHPLGNGPDAESESGPTAQSAFDTRFVRIGLGCGML